MMFFCQVFNNQFDCDFKSLDPKYTNNELQINYL